MSALAFTYPLRRTHPSSVSSLHDVQSLEILHPDPLQGLNNTLDLLQQGAAIAPEAPALSFFLKPEHHEQPFVWTHRQMVAKVIQTANMFRRLGLRQGEVVAIVLPNLPETHWVIWSSETAGISFAIDPLLDASAMLALMTDAKVKLIVTMAPTPGADLWEKISTIATALPGLKAVLTVSPMHYMRSPLAQVLKLVSCLQTPARLARVPVWDFHKQLEGTPDHALEFAPPMRGDVASYAHTGGSPTQAKIAVRLQRTEISNALQLAATFGHTQIGPDKTVFCGMPLPQGNTYIETGLTQWSRGGHVLMGAAQGFRAPGLMQRFWSIAETHQVSMFSAEPSVYAELLRIPRERSDLSKLKYGMCTKACLPADMHKRFQIETGIKVLDSYAQAGGGSISTITPPTGLTKTGSVGIRQPWQDIRTVKVSRNGAYIRDAHVDEPGYIVIQGPNVFQGYLHPTHNQGLWIDIPDEDGIPRRWLATDDIGHTDHQGYFWLTGTKLQHTRHTRN